MSDRAAPLVVLILVFQRRAVSGLIAGAKLGQGESAGGGKLVPGTAVAP